MVVVSSPRSGANERSAELLADSDGFGKNPSSFHQPYRPMKILLADDDQISRKIISGFLARFGYQVQVVADGAEAWDVLQRQNPPQLAIFDWMMPRMSGLEVSSKVRGLNRKERIYIILLSSRNSKLDIVKGLEAGADDYLVKPCDLAELQARLRVAERAIKHDQQLRKTINELESLVRRHNLLGSIAASANTPAPEPAAPATTPAPASTPAAPQLPPAQPPAPTAAPQVPPLDAAIAQAFQEVGLGPAAVAQHQDFNTGPEFSVMLPLCFPGAGRWVDLRFEFDRRSAHSACRCLLKRGANSPQELQDVLVELVHLVSGAQAMGAVKKSSGMFGLTAAPVVNPSAPEEMHRPDGKRYRVQSSELRANVTEFSTAAPVAAKPASQLVAGEVITANIPSPKSADTVLAYAGDILTQNRISNLVEAGVAGSISVACIPKATLPYLAISF